MASFSMKVDFPTDAELDRMFDVVGAMHRYGAADKVVKAMGKIVLERAKQLVPRSKKNPKGDPTKKWSQKYAHRVGEMPLWQSLKLVVRRTSKLSYALVGPMWREGSKAYFNMAYRKGSREVYLWGKAAGRSVQATRNWILQACDETKPQQIDAAKTELRKFLKDTYGG